MANTWIIYSKRALAPLEYSLIEITTHKNQNFDSLNKLNNIFGDTKSVFWSGYLSVIA